jgi:branched-chain amino acid transport system ATP-binding protein
MSPIIELADVGRAYGERVALAGVSLALEEGQTLAVFGANGAGKTTLLRAVCNMIRTSGEVRLAGERIDGLATEAIVRRGVGHVPDGRGTFMNLTVEENLRLGAHTRKDRGEIGADCERMYAYFPRLKERRRQQAGTLSGGEQQMLAVSRALMLRPRLLLLDEPSFGLAPLIVQQLFEILKAINGAERIGMLLVEQNAAMALALADQAYLLETGRVVMSGSAQSIRSDEQVRRSYLGY